MAKDTNISEGENEFSRREFLGQGAALAVTTTMTTSLASQVLAQEVAENAEPREITVDPKLLEAIPYRESELGIDYRELTKNTPPPSPQDELFAHMLSNGEAEWMENAKVDYEEDTQISWQEFLLPEVASGAVSELTVEELRDYCPEMLTRFGLLDHNDEKYDLLWVYGSKFISETA